MPATETIPRMPSELAQAERDCLDAEKKHEELKAMTKEAKDNYESAVLRMRRMIRDYAEPGIFDLNDEE